MVTILRAVALTAVLGLAFATAQSADQRIISLAGDVTEIIFALGEQDQLVAVDATSVYPAAANDLENIGFAGRMSAEALIAFEPTLVIATSAAQPAAVFDQLRAAGVDVVFVAEDLSISTPVENIRTVAALVGAEAQGEALAAEVQAKIDEAVARGSALDPKPRVLFLYLGSATMQFAAGADTSSNVMIEAAGGIDAGEEVGFVGNTPFTTEALVTSAPDVLIVTDRGIRVMGDVDGVLAIPGVSETPAGQNGNVIVFEDLYFLGLGPRTGDALLELVDRLQELQ